MQSGLIGDPDQDATSGRQGGRRLTSPAGGGRYGGLVENSGEPDGLPAGLRA